MSFAFISDVHSQHELLSRALDHCANKGLVPIMLGDLFDSCHDQGNAFYTLTLAKKAISDLGATVLNSNHHDKFSRFAKGNNVKMTPPFNRTVADLRGSGCDIVDLGVWLSGLPLGIVFHDSHGTEYRVAHAFFPGKQAVPEISGVVEIHKGNTQRELVNHFLYGPVVKNAEGERVRLDWWREPKNSTWRRVAGHYHEVYEDSHSLVLDAGCGGTSRHQSFPEEDTLLLYEVDNRLIRRFSR